LNLVICKLNI